MKRNKRLCILFLAVLPVICTGMSGIVATNNYNYEEPCEIVTVSVSPTCVPIPTGIPTEITVNASTVVTPAPVIVYSIKEDVSTEAQEVEVYDAIPFVEDIKSLPPLEELKEVEAVEQPSTEDEECLTLASSNKGFVEYISPKGNVYVIDTERLNSIYSSPESFKNMGLGDYNTTAAVIYDFLVFQMGVEHNIACGIVGNCAAEGKFGKKQSVKRYISSIEEARSWLDRDAVDTGYGIAQWTTGGRRERLLDYYESAVKVFDNFEDAQKVAELVNLYEEIEDYDVFGSYDDIVTVEDATGRISLIYERYKYSTQDWTKNKNGTVSLTGDIGSGSKRLKYAYRVHKFYSALQ